MLSALFVPLRLLPQKRFGVVLRLGVGLEVDALDVIVDLALVERPHCRQSLALIDR